MKQNNERTIKYSAFFERLDSLDNGDRTALKRALGKTLEQAKSTARAAFYKLPSVNENQENVYFFIAASVAYCDEDSNKSFITCLKEVNEMDKDSNSVEHRLIALLDINIHEQPEYFYSKMGRMIRMLRQKEKVPCFNTLLDDLIRWDNDSKYRDSDSRRVQRRWTKEFFVSAMAQKGN